MLEKEVPRVPEKEVPRVPKVRVLELRLYRNALPYI